jgi:hypothetical protein
VERNNPLSLSKKFQYAQKSIDENASWKARRLQELNGTMQLRQ